MNDHSVTADVHGQLSGRGRHGPGVHALAGVVGHNPADHCTCHGVGAVVMARVELGPVSAAAFEATPVAVLTAVVAPAALTHGMPEAIAGAAAVLVGLRAPMAVVIVVAMATVVAMRHMMG